MELIVSMLVLTRFLGASGGCVGGGVGFIVKMTDSYGDGWNGDVLHIGSEKLTLGPGKKVGSEVICLPLGSYAPYCCGGDYPSESFWSIDEIEGRVGVVSGGADTNCAPEYGSFEVSTPAPTKSPTPTTSPTVTAAPSTTFSPSASPHPLPTPAPHATILVYSETELRAAVLKSAAVIDLKVDIVLLATLSISTTVALYGNGFKLDGQGRINCVRLAGPNARVLIYDLVITHGYTSASGGGLIALNKASLIMVNCTVSNSVAMFSGGGLRIYLGVTVELRGCVITGNHANTDSGGGISCDLSNLTMDNCIVSYNTAYYGGGLSSNFISGTARVLSSTFIFNHASYGGGGISFESGNVVISGCNIDSNVAAVGGGVFVSQGSYVQLFGGIISDNKATKGGGGVYFTGDSTKGSIIKTTIVRNLAHFSSGAGLFLAGGSVSLDDMSIEYNSARGPVFQLLDGACYASGGCFYSSPSYPKDFSNNVNCTWLVTENGTLDVLSFRTEVDYDILTVNGMKFSGESNGPSCVEVKTGSKINFVSSGNNVASGFEICYAGVASNGGGIFIAGGKLEMRNSVVSSNFATRQGGGVHVSVGNAILFNTTVIKNSASSVTGVFLASGSFDATALHLSDSLGGVSSSAAFCRSSCLAGEYGRCKNSSDAPNCFYDCRCLSCPAGQFSSTLGATGFVCESCGAGLISEAGSKSCAACDAGTFSTNSESNKNGGIDSQVALGAVACQACPAGLYAPRSLSLVCQACPVGFYSSDGAKMCEPCLPGQYAPASSASCSLCKEATYSAGETATCTPCSLDKYSMTGSSACALAAPGFYLATAGSGSISCPLNAVCNGLEESPRPFKGFWVYVGGETEKYRDVILPCGRNTCLGAVSLNSLCWKSKTPASCPRVDTLQCSKGAFGLLCGSCLSGFSLSSSTLMCVSCKTGSGHISIVLKIMLAIVGFLLLAAYHLGGLCVSPVCNGLRAMMPDKGMLKVLWSSYQILNSIPWNLNVIFPQPFQGMLQIFSFFQLDFLSFKCLDHSSNFQSTVLIASLAPLALCCVFGAATLLSRCSKSRNREIEFKCASSILLTSYLVLPPVSMLQLKALDCQTLFDGELQFVRVDTAIDCTSKAYSDFRVAVIFLSLVYQSVPLAWLILLWKKRKILGYSNVSETEEIVAKRRNMDPRLRHLSFLFNDYRPTMWYFEALDMWRRIAFVAVIPLLGSEKLRAAIGCFVAAVILVYYREAAPFMIERTNLLNDVASFQILVTFISAIYILANSNSSDFGIGTFLLLANCLILGFSALWCWQRWRRTRQEKSWRRALSTQEARLLEEFAVNGISTIKSPTPRGSATADLRQVLLNATDVELVSRIGSGSFGEVFHARYLGQECVAKTLISVTDASLRNFRAEIILTSSLRHPNIVLSLGCCWEAALVCLVLEFVSKGSLGDFAESNRGLTWADPLLKLSTDIARGMAYLHGREYWDAAEGAMKRCIVHRDLKLDNVLVTAYLSAKISDFGTSRNKGDAATVMTSVGTPLFCSGELFRGEAYDESVDVYSYGLVLLAMSMEEPLLDFMLRTWSSGKSRGRSKNVTRMLYDMHEHGWCVLDERRPLHGVPPSILSLISRCLSRQPSARPSFESVVSCLLGQCKDEIDNESFVRLPRSATIQEEASIAGRLPPSQGIGTLPLGPMIELTPMFKSVEVRSLQASLHTRNSDNPIFRESANEV